MPPLPEYLPPIEDYKPETPLKKINLKKITPNKIPKEAIWVQIDDQLQTGVDKLFEGLQDHFSSGLHTKKVNVDMLNEKAASKRIKQLRVLDPKAAQNLMITLSSIKMTADELARNLLTVNEEQLNDAVLQQLLKYIPQAPQLKQLEEFRKDFDDLHEAEQFALTVSVS